MPAHSAGRTAISSDGSTRPRSPGPTFYASLPVASLVLLPRAICDSPLTAAASAAGVETWMRGSHGGTEPAEMATYLPRLST
jgi:hypothetical protein